ncbi:MAG: TetR family transcriptional regulator [Pseudomonadota bacterium]
MKTAIQMFSSFGYDGVSIRALEVQAGVQRGAVAYHFDGKEELWKSMVDEIMDRFGAHIDPLSTTIQDLDKKAGNRALMAALIRFSAETPEFNRLMMSEGGRDTWRMSYIVDHVTKGRFSWVSEYSGMFRDAHDYYIMIGAATFVFGVEHECRRIFDVDPTTDTFIREHASRVSDLWELATEARRTTERS